MVCFVDWNDFVLIWPYIVIKWVVVRTSQECCIMEHFIIGSVNKGLLNGTTDCFLVILGLFLIVSSRISYDGMLSLDKGCSGNTKYRNEKYNNNR